MCSCALLVYFACFLPVLCGLLFVVALSLFVVDEDGKPIQVLSLTDIITFLWASWTEEEMKLYAEAHSDQL
jgi:hypothetical protein